MDDTMQLERTRGAAPSHLLVYSSAEAKEFKDLRGKTRYFKLAKPVDSRSTLSIANAKKLLAGHKVEMQVIENRGLKLTILDVDFKGNHAYATVVDNNSMLYYVNADNIIKDAVLSSGVLPKGELPDEYMWVYNAPSDFRFEREVNRDKFLPDLPEIEKESLHLAPQYNPGEVYRNAKGELFLYLGEVRLRGWRWEDKRPVNLRTYFEGMVFKEGEYAFKPASSFVNEHLWVKLVDSPLKEGELYQIDYTILTQKTTPKRYLTKQPDHILYPRTVAEYCNGYRTHVENLLSNMEPNTVAYLSLKAVIPMLNEMEAHEANKASEKVSDSAPLTAV